MCKVFFHLSIFFFHCLFLNASQLTLLAATAKSICAVLPPSSDVSCAPSRNSNRPRLMPCQTNVAIHSQNGFFARTMHVLSAIFHLLSCLSALTPSACPSAIFISSRSIPHSPRLPLLAVSLSSLKLDFHTSNPI